MGRLDAVTVRKIACGGSETARPWILVYMFYSDSQPVCLAASSWRRKGSIRSRDMILGFGRYDSVAVRRVFCLFHSPWSRGLELSGEEV